MLHINSLKGKVNDKAIEDALAEVRSGGSSLISAYDKTMRMIESQDDGYRKLAMHTLSWVAFSSAPLTTEQLQHALAIEPDTTRLDFNNITKLEVILSTCAGLITIQKHRWGDPETIHLVHETTQDYFLETREKYFGSVRTRLACLSLTYLTFHTFESGHCDHNMLASKGVQYPLHGYLVRGFPDFIDGIEEDIRVKTLLKKFLLGDGYVASYMRATGSYSAYPEHLITLRLAISYRLGSCIPEIIRKAGYKRNKLEFWPLHLAVKTGYHEGIQNLLAAPEVDCNATTEEGRSALSYACELGNERSVALLLACDGIACNITDENGRSPLTYALEHGWLSVVQLLLERTDVDYISPDSYGWIPLFYADLGSSEACIKELLGMPNLGDDMVVNKGRTPLIWCIEHRCLQAALLILSREDIKLSAPSQTERGPFIRAVRWGQPKLIAAFLRKSGTNIFAKDSSYRTALDHAAECGNWQVVRELLARYKTKIRIKHRLKGTALFYAIKYASSDILTLVLNQVALDKSWWFVDALYLSIENNRVECFMMLKMKLGVWMRDNPRWLTMCLRHAAEKGDDHTLNTILESAEYNDTGLDEEHVHILSDRTWNDIAIYEALFEIPASQVNARDRLGQTALHAVTRRQDFAATRILLIIGVDKAARDNEGRTAFECASDWPRRLGNLKKKLQPKSSSAAH
jgi:ankyrin repeat protein